MKPPTAQELERWDKLDREATPGPWFFNSYSSVFSAPLSEKDDWRALLFQHAHIEGGDTATPSGISDCEFIAASREALPRLIAYARDRMKTCRWVKYKNSELESGFLFAPGCIPEMRRYAGPPVLKGCCPYCGRTVEVDGG